MSEKSSTKWVDQNLCNLQPANIETELQEKMKTVSNFL